jgi:tetrahydromethanopterin S-methyltransferase subunit D
MINAGFVDFAFMGVAVVPEILLMAGYVAEALMLMVPMLIGACLFGLYHQKVHADEPEDEVPASTADIVVPDAGKPLRGI